MLVIFGAGNMLLVRHLELTLTKNPVVKSCQWVGLECGGMHGSVITVLKGNATA